MENFPETDLALSERDRLFDILMERFDLANQDRAALTSILHSFKTDPKQMVISLPHLGLSMSRMCELAEIDTQGLRGALRVMGLMGAYVWVLRTWLQDDSPDLSKTMSALDKTLSRLEQTADRAGL
jgi:hypothetical protein